MNADKSLTNGDDYNIALTLLVDIIKNEPDACKQYQVSYKLRSNLCNFAQYPPSLVSALP